MIMKIVQFALLAAVFNLQFVLGLSTSTQKRLKGQFVTASLNVPVPLLACVEGDAKYLTSFDTKRLSEELRSMSETRPFKIDEIPRESLLHANITVSYQVAAPNACDQADLVLELTAQKAQSDTGSGFRLLNGKVRGHLQGGTGRGASGEVLGRSFGWFLTAARFWQASDLTRHLFYSVHDDDGVEVSIIGWSKDDSDSPHAILEKLDLSRLSRVIASWLGVPETKVILKVTTRSLHDHSHAHAAFLQAQRSRSVTQQVERGVDGIAFLQSMAESTDALLRGGTAARLIRMRRREIEIYVFTTSSEDQTLSNGAHVQAWKEDLMVLIPPGTLASRFELLNRAILLGLAHSCAGVPLLAEVVSDPVQVQDDFAWVDVKAISNVVVYEFAQSLRLLEDAIGIHETIARIDVRVIDQLADIRDLIMASKWQEARTQLRTKVKDSLKKILRIAHEEKRKCCKRTLAFSSTLSPDQRKKLFFKYLYVMILGFGGVSVAIYYFSRTKFMDKDALIFQPARLFGRVHGD